MKQKILRRKVTITIPYTDLTSGYKAKTLLDDLSLKTPNEWAKVMEHPGAEIEFGEIEETSRKVEVAAGG